MKYQIGAILIRKTSSIDYTIVKIDRYCTDNIYHAIIIKNRRNIFIHQSSVHHSQEFLEEYYRPLTDLEKVKYL